MSPVSKWTWPLGESGRAHSGAHGFPPHVDSSRAASLMSMAGHTQGLGQCVHEMPPHGMHNVAMVPSPASTLDLSGHCSETPQPLEPLHYPTPASWARDLGT